MGRVGGKEVPEAVGEALPVHLLDSGGANGLRGCALGRCKHGVRCARVGLGSLVLGVAQRVGVGQRRVVPDGPIKRVVGSLEVVGGRLQAHGGDVVVVGEAHGLHLARRFMRGLAGKKGNVPGHGAHFPRDRAGHQLPFWCPHVFYKNACAKRAVL